MRWSSSYLAARGRRPGPHRAWLVGHCGPRRELRWLRHAIVLWYRSRDLPGRTDGWAVLPLATASQRYLGSFFGHDGGRYSLITRRDMGLEGRGRVVVVKAIARLGTGIQILVRRRRSGGQESRNDRPPDLTVVADSFKSDRQVTTSRPMAMGNVSAVRMDTPPGKRVPVRTWPWTSLL